MSPFIAGFSGQLLRLVRTRKLRALLALFVGACVATAAIYAREVVEDLPVAVLDLDNSRLSRVIRQSIEATPELRTVADAPSSIEEAREQMIAGRIVGAVVIPEGLAASVKRGRKGEVLAAIDMSNILLGKTTWKALARSLNLVSGGVELTWLRKLGERPGPARARILPVAVDETLAFNPGTSYAIYVAPALLFFFLHILVVILASSAYLPPDAAAGPGELLGREAAVFAVGVAGGLLLAYGLLPLYGIAPQASPAVVLAILGAFCLVDLLLVGAFQAAIPSPTLAFQAALLLAMLSLMLSGATFPVDGFPAPLQALARSLPFTPFARGVRLLLQERIGFADAAEVLEALGAQAAAFAGVVAAAMAVRRGVVGVGANRPC